MFSRPFLESIHRMLESTGEEQIPDRYAAFGFSTGGWGENINLTRGIEYQSRRGVYSPAQNGGYFSYEYRGDPIPPRTYLRLAEEAVRSWMTSSGHRRNILNPSFRYLGVGAAHFTKASFHDIDSFCFTSHGWLPLHRTGSSWYPRFVNRDHALQILKDIFPQLQTYGVRDIALFGSVARNDADGSSDIDILIDFEPEAESFDNLMNVADLLDMRFDAPVDLVTVNGLSPYLVASVREEAVHAEIA